MVAASKGIFSFENQGGGVNSNKYDNDISAVIESAKKENYYKNYLSVRDSVISMLGEAHGGTDIPSHYWEEELAGFDYLLDASPLIIRKLREHSYHITGLKSYEYRRHHAHKAVPYQQKLAALQQADAHNLFIPEARELGGFGHEIDGDLVNIDTLKFYESLIALDRVGTFDRLRQLPERPIVVEIGGGWGGFAYQFKKTCPICTYVIIDLPQTILFSGVYLKTTFPDARTFIYGENGQMAPTGNIRDYDFVLMPHFSTQSFRLPQVDLGINMISFQEMTSEQVLGYARWFWESDCKSLYSHNRARSAHNDQLSDVSQLLGQRFEMEEITVLPVPYTVLQLPQPTQWSANPKKMARQIVQRMLTPVMKVAASHLDYRHLVGLPRASFIEGLVR